MNLKFGGDFDLEFSSKNGMKSKTSDFIQLLVMKTKCCNIIIVNNSVVALLLRVVAHAMYYVASENFVCPK